MRRFLLPSLLVLSLAACAPKIAPPTPPAEASSSSVASVKTLEDVNAAVLNAFGDKDMAKLALYVHPAKGVRFSPYAYVNTEENVIIRQKDIAGLMKETAARTWGTEDGSGEPIDKTFAEYYTRFVFDHDFRKAPDIHMNEVNSYGSSTNNIAEAYPGASWFEYHFPGFDSQYDGMDWRALRLVYEKDDGRWYLVGVIHDEWGP